MSSPPATTTFDDDQYNLPYSIGSEHHFWNIARNRIIERHLRRVIAAQQMSNGLVLDVGCGPGVVVDHLRRSGIDCEGVELGRPPVRPGLEPFVRVGTDATSLPQNIRERTSTILLLDVLEHIQNPDAFLASLMDAYPSVEHFIVTLPARMELWSNYDDYYGHFLRYDANAVRALAKACNLHVVSLKYFFNALYPVMASMVWRSQTRTLETRPPSGAILRGLHALVGASFSLEERIPFMGAVPGTSLLAVLSPRAGSGESGAR
ncbi:class I SAM-dependent methyltransferase [Bradyrhizobium sp. dw_411]|uniref:class I SAM-dependent methyltransferase n=1 Tax=Bradyrhizobium sp. dw_411 TaxID=2720082 RepID=UPI001BD0A5DB|nr:class I SAM-dependent methyltransferase [Bradyrhizobium sp. dw_411]